MTLQLIFINDLKKSVFSIKIIFMCDGKNLKIFVTIMNNFKHYEQRFIIYRAKYFYGFWKLDFFRLLLGSAYIYLVKNYSSEREFYDYFFPHDV